MTQEQYGNFNFAYSIDSNNRSTNITPKDFAQRVSTLRGTLNGCFLEEMVVQRDHSSEPESFPIDEGIGYLRTLKDRPVHAMQYSAQHKREDAHLKLERPAGDQRILVSAEGLPSHLYDMLVGRIKKPKKDWSVTTI